MNNLNSSQYFNQSHTQPNFQMSKEEAISKLKSLNKSTKNIIFWNAKFQFVDLRKNVFKNEIFNLCQQLNYRPTTFFLAIGVFDNFMGDCLVKGDIVKCIPYICLNIASKFNEDHRTFLNLLDVKKFMPEFDIKFIMLMEKIILQEMKFNVNLNTIYHNLFYLLHLIETNLISYDSEIKKKFIDKCFSMANSLIINYDTNKFNPFVTATTIINIFENILNMDIKITQIIGKNLLINEKEIFQKIIHCEEFIYNYFTNNSCTI